MPRLQVNYFDESREAEAIEYMDEVVKVSARDDGARAFC